MENAGRPGPGRAALVAALLGGVLIGGIAVYALSGLLGGPPAATSSPPLIAAPSLTPSPKPTPTPTPRPTPSPTPTPTPTPSPPPTPTPTPTPTATPAAPATPAPTAPPTAAPTEGPESHTSPALEAVLPDSVGGRALHRTSPDVSAQLAADPRAASALTLLGLVGKGPQDIHFAQAVDAADPTRLAILAFQVSGLDARMFGGAVANVLITAMPGAQTSTVTLGGRTITKATPPAGSPSVYLYEKGDTAYAIQTADEALATEALTKLP